VVPSAAVVRLANRQAEIAANLIGIEIIKKRAVVEQKTALALLRIAGELPAADRKVARAGACDILRDSG
jgi:hypothetical protein